MTTTLRTPNAVSRPVLAGLFLSASALCSVAQAGLVQADYLAGGDQLAVLDTSQNLTWLDLSVSAGWSTSNWASNVAPGAGWRLATNDEVLNLLIDAFPSIGAPELVNSQTYNSPSVLADIAGFTALFGRTWTDTRTYGFYQDEDAVWRMAGVDDFGSNRTLWGGEFSVNYNVQAAAGSSVFGMYIVKAADVPEPASLALVGLALAGLGWQRRKAR